MIFGITFVETLSDASLSGSGVSADTASASVNPNISLHSIRPDEVLNILLYADITAFKGAHPHTDLQGNQLLQVYGDQQNLYFYMCDDGR